MTAGAIVAARALPRRQRWEQQNTQAAIMLDWDDVQAVATRAPQVSSTAALLRDYKSNGATHLSLPELTLQRLLHLGHLSVIQGPDPERVTVQSNRPALVSLLSAELAARLPHLDPRPEGDSALSFRGDLPTVAEVGLGFDPAHAALALEAGLQPVARPIGYSWMQPEMIERTLAQTAELGASIVAVQGQLIPGHEFEIQHTVEAMRRHRLTYAYFRETRHQKGDWFLAKHLAPDGLVLLAHELSPAELLDEDLHTAAYRWGNLAAETGIRLCSVRFFRILHAANPLESLEYVHQIAHALHHAGIERMENEPPDLTTVSPALDAFTLAGVGLSAAGAAGLATDLLPLPAPVKLLGISAGAIALAGLPYLKTGSGHQLHGYSDDYGHSHPDDDYHHQGHGHPHGDHHHDHHHHEHEHGHHHGPAPAATAYAQKGLALAATIAFPAATAAISGPNMACVLAQAALVSAAGAVVVSATTVEADYLLGIEEYRGYNLDWLLPLGLVLGSGWLKGETGGTSSWPWLVPVGGGLAVWQNLRGAMSPDWPATFDREHRHAHTHHLSQFQAGLGDARMALAPRPLRKWAMLTPLGLMGAVGLKHIDQPELAALALAAASAGQVALLTGFRQGQRPLAQAVRGRSRSWAMGAGLALLGWAALARWRREA
jgi:hypothetical protein